MAEVAQQLTEQEIIDELYHCKRDFFYWLNNYIWIESKDEESASLMLGKRPIKLNLWNCQDALLHFFPQFRKHCILKRRQIGLSTLVGLYLLWKAQFHTHVDALVVSEIEVKAIEFLDRIKFSFMREPQWMKPTVGKDITKCLEFSVNESQIRVSATTDTVGRSFTCTDFVADEAAFISDLMKLLAAAEPGVDAVGGQVFVISTGDMYGDEFHQIFTQSWEGRSEYRGHFIPFADDDGQPARPDQTVEWRKKKIEESFDPALTRREYPMTIAEAFLSPGESVFHQEKLQALHDNALENPPLFVGDLYGDRDKGFDLVPNPKGRLKIWEFPRTDRGYVQACDVAQGVKGGDFSSIHVRDRDTRKVVAHWHGRCDEAEFTIETYRLGSYYRWAFTGVEANNTGIWVARELDRQKDAGGLGYPPECLLRRQAVDKPGSDRTEDKLGWWTGETSRSALVGDLAKALVNDQLPLYDIDTISEMMSFKRNDRGKPEAARGARDDRVISLGLSEQCLHNCYLPIDRGPAQDEMTDCAKHIEKVLGKGYLSRRAAGYPDKTEQSGRVFWI